MSRRTFLKGVRNKALGLAATAAVGGPTAIGAKWVKDEMDRRSAPIEKKFARNNLEEFLPFFQATQDFLGTYRRLPQYSEYRYGSVDPVSILRFVSNSGSIDNGDKKNLLEGWGVLSEQAVERAKEKVGKIHIDTTNGLPDTQDSVRAAYLRYAEVFPYDVLVAPDNLLITHGEGWYMGHEKYRPEDTGMKMALASPANDIDNFYVQAMHEHGHALQSKWLAGKPFVDRKAYFDFLTTRTQKIKEVVDNYFSLDWDDAQTFSDGHVLVLGSPIDMNKIRKHEADMVEYGCSFPEIEGEQMNDVSFRFNRIAHAIGKKYLEARTKEKNGQKLTKNESSLIYYVSDFFIETVINELDHYFVGPVQKAKGGIPSSTEDVGFPDSIMTKANLAIQQARLRTFSTFSPEEVENPDASFHALQRHLIA